MTEPDPLNDPPPAAHANDAAERERRWRLAVGGDNDGLSGKDQRIAQALDALYAAPSQPTGGRGGRSGGGKRGGLGRSAPKVAKWMGEVRAFFPARVVQILQQDAFERLGLKEMLMEPEFLDAVEADVDLVADLMTLGQVMPDKTRDTARRVIAKVVAELMERLERRTAQTLRGALDRGRRTHRPRAADIDWPRTLRRNLHTWQPDPGVLIPERLVGFQRRQRRLVDLDEVVLCVDQSGSMATSVIYASIFSAVMATLPVIRTKLICFDTAVVDLTDKLADPVDVLFGVQLGGGTDINQAVACCETRIERPSKAHLVLITDLYEGGDEDQLVLRLGGLMRLGVNVIVLLALADDGQPASDARLAARVAALGAPVFACTPDHFPDLMAAALRRDDLHAWAATHNLHLTPAI